MSRFPDHGPARGPHASKVAGCAAALVNLWLVGFAPPARAIECPAIAGGVPSLAQVDPAERLRFLRESLRRDARHARIWAWGWGITYSAITTGELVAAPFFTTTGDRNDSFIAAGGAAVGVLVLLIMPPKVLGDQRRFERRVAATPVPDCALLAEGERVLVRDAGNERDMDAWWIHAGNVIFNLGLSLAIGFTSQHWTRSAISFATGTTIGEIQFATGPSGAIEALDRYRAGDLQPPATRDARSWFIVPTVGADSLGLSLGFRD